MQNWLFQNIGWLIAMVVAVILTLILARRKSQVIPIPSENNRQVSAQDISNSCFVVGDYNQVSLHIQSLVESAGGDPAKLREAYLYALQCDAGFLSLRGIDPKAASCAADSRMKLDAVYTALLTEEAERSDAHEFQSRDARRISALEVLDQHPHVVLLGNPGTGKSTFVNFIAWCMSGGLLGDSQKYLDLLTAPMPSDDEDDFADSDDDDKQPHQLWRHGLLVPVRIILRDFAAKGDISFNGLWKFIADELGKYKLGDYEQHLFKELQNTGGLWLLDGLDEVPEADNCRVRIRQTVQDLIKSFRNCRILVTSRTYAYRKQDWQIPGLHEAELAPFSDAQIRKFIDMWYAHVAELRQSDTASARAELLKDAVFSNPRIRELAERPLLLTLMASLHSWRGGSLPEKREQLYADTTDLLLDTWERQRVPDHPSLIEWLKTDKTRMRRVLSELAYNAHARQPKNEAGTADIAESELFEKLCGISDDPEIRPMRLIEFLSNRSGLLIPRGVGIFSFPHRTFQEYLSACYLTENDFPEKIAELTRTEPDRWREVCLLAGAKQGAGVIWSLADHLCFKEADDSSADREDIWGAQMAGQALAETAILDKVSPANKIKLDRVRQWLIRIMEKNELPAKERALAGNSLAILGDTRFNRNNWYLPYDDDISVSGFITIPAGSFMMGSKDEQDTDMWNNKLLLHEVHLSEYAIGKYPVTVAQYKAFLADSGHRADDEWKRWNRYDNHPVVEVSWHDAVAYCEWLAKKLNCKITLPTEAQWEYAARGSDGRIYPWGDEPDPDKANYDDTGIASTSAVGCFPNGESPYRISDMSGNVWEWCYDWYGDYPADAVTDPMGAEKGSNRVLRGGGWYPDAGCCRTANRFSFSPGFRNYYNGFRLVRS